MAGDRAVEHNYDSNLTVIALSPCHILRIVISPSQI